MDSGPGDETLLLRLPATARPRTRGRVSVLGPAPEIPAERTGIRRRLGYLLLRGATPEPETAGEVAL